METRGVRRELRLIMAAIVSLLLRDDTSPRNNVIIPCYNLIIECAAPSGMVCL